MILLLNLKKYIFALETNIVDFVVGFDLVGQEDLGRPLMDFAQILIEAKLKFPNLK